MPLGAAPAHRSITAELEGALDTPSILYVQALLFMLGRCSQ